MWCVTEMGKTSCLCFPQIGECKAFIHNAKAKCRSVTHLESCLLSPHILYLPGLLFCLSLCHSTCAHGPNSALSSCLAWSLCNPFPSWAVLLILPHSVLWSCGGVRGPLRALTLCIEAWEGRTQLSGFICCLKSMRRESSSKKQNAASGLWTGSNPSSWDSFFSLSFLPSLFGVLQAGKLSDCSVKLRI